MKDDSKRVRLLEMFSRMNMPTLRERKRERKGVKRENSLSSQHPDFMNDEHFWL